jgi:hypothetical protein
MVVAIANGFVTVTSAGGRMDQRVGNVFAGKKWPLRGQPV